MTYGSHRAIYVTRKADEIWDETTTRDRVSRKPGWMFWASFANGKKGPCLFWEKEWGSINASSYQVSSIYVLSTKLTFLSDRIIPLIDGWIRLQRGEGNLLPEDEDPVHLRLVQDNAPAHAAASTIADLEGRGIELIRWPPFSPDLNLIENLWNKMKDYQDKHWGDEVCSNAIERSRILESWGLGVTDEYLHQLILEMPDRCEAVLRANGGPTRW